MTGAARVAELLRDRGWTQNDFQSPNGALCLLGAVYVAVGGRVITETSEEGWQSRPSIGDAENQSTYQALLTDIAERIGTRPNSTELILWNDNPGRTQDQVLALLESPKGTSSEPSAEA